MRVPSLLVAIALATGCTVPAPTVNTSGQNDQLVASVQRRLDTYKIDANAGDLSRAQLTQIKLLQLDEPYASSRMSIQQIVDRPAGS